MTRQKEMERTRMIKAMEFIIRNVNDEELIMPWLMNGVADGDIEYGDFAPCDENMEYYIEDDEFSEMMGLFLRLMSKANKDGGLYCGGVVSK